MSLLYDPKTKKTKIWVPVLFVLLPILLIVGGFFLGQTQVKKKSTHPDKDVKVDVFDRIDDLKKEKLNK
ncbi:MAG: hypothetical protein KC713_00935 [Candidatus Omnitrophica bacterium]|nr:hypothetical protein [Candidatus Omnitrophota bacterium]